MSENVTAEELLELLLKAKEEKKTRKPYESKKAHSAKRFIKQWGITAGDDRVPTFVIYYTYKILWKGDKGPNKCRKLPFFREFRKHFDQVRTGKYRYYLLDKSKFNMTKEGILEAKQHDKTEKLRQKTIAETKRRKISEPGKGSKPKG